MVIRKYKFELNREEYDINTIVKCNREFHNVSGVIIDKRRIQQPFNTNSIILYLIKNSNDNHLYWINSIYVSKVIK